MVQFGLEGRGFTLWDLKRAWLSACGSLVNPTYFLWPDLDLWEMIETIEMAADLNKRPEADG